MTSLTRHTVQSWLCCVLSSSVHKLAGMSHYTVTVQVTMSSHVELTLSDIVTVTNALLLVCQFLCKHSISGVLHCLHHLLPCVREGPCSFMTGDPLHHQLQCTVSWLGSFTSSLPSMTRWSTARTTPTAAILYQLALESSKNVCRQRRQQSVVTGHNWILP